MKLKDLIKSEEDRIDLKLTESGIRRSSNLIRIERESRYNPIINAFSEIGWDDFEGVNFDGETRLVLYPTGEPNLIVSVTPEQVKRDVIPYLQQPIFSMHQKGYRIEVFERLERDTRLESESFYFKQLRNSGYDKTGMNIELFRFRANDERFGSIDIPIAVDCEEVRKPFEDSGPPRTTREYMPLVVQWRHHCKIAKESRLLQQLLHGKDPEPYPVTITVSNRVTER
jgi:hypothetical protein